VTVAITREPMENEWVLATRELIEPRNAAGGGSNTIDVTSFHHHNTVHDQKPADLIPEFSSGPSFSPILTSGSAHLQRPA